MLRALPSYLRLVLQFARLIEKDIDVMDVNSTKYVWRNVLVLAEEVSCSSQERIYGQYVG